MSGFLKKILIIILLSVSGIAGAFARNANNSDAGQTLTPTEFGGLVVMSGFRPIAVDILWIRAEDLARERRYYELLSLYNMIAALDPHFEGAWVYNSFNLAYRISELENTEEKKWRWVREGLLYAMRGMEKNPNSHEIAFAISWIYYNRIGNSEYFIGRTLEDGILNPENKSVIELARGWAERGFSIRPHTIYIDWTLEFIYRSYGNQAVDPIEKIRYLRKRIEIWEGVKSDKPHATKIAREKIKTLKKEINSLTVR